MRYDHLRAFEKHVEEAKASRFSPIYMILGKEEYECREAIELLLHAILPSSEIRSLALTQIDGAKADEQEMGNALYSFSFFAKTRILWIKEADKLKKGVQENLLKYLDKPDPSQTLLLSAASFLKNTNFYKAVDKAGVILDIAELKPWEKEQRLAEWLNKRAAVSRKVIAYPVCQLLVKRVGPDQTLLAQELEKLLCYIGERKEILQQDVEALCPKLHVDTIWQLGEALFRKDAAGAIPMMHSLLNEGQPLLLLLRQIRSQYQTGFQVSLLLAAGKQQEISQEFPYMKGQLLEKNIRQAQQYGTEAYQKGLIALDEAELRSKNSFAEEKIIAELLLFQLCRL